jgi:hypothetical protein
MIVEPDMPESPVIAPGTAAAVVGEPAPEAPSVEALLPDGSEPLVGELPGSGQSRREVARHQFGRLVEGVKHGDDASVESAVLALSQRSRLLAPLALIVGSFLMLFHGLRLLFVNWRLTLVQILPAMWIWVAMVDLKAHLLHGKSFHPLYGPWLIPIVAAIAALTAGSFFLNAVFAFAVAQPGSPQIRPAFAEARVHQRTILAWGLGVGVALGFATMVTNRWGERWFGLSLGIVVAVMMVSYVSVPARLVGVQVQHSTKDKLAASAVGGAIGALICSPPYALGRVALLMIGSHTFFWLAIVLLAIAVVLQTGATSAVKAVKMSAKLVAGQGAAQVVAGERASAAASPTAAADSTEPAAVPPAG